MSGIPGISRGSGAPGGTGSSGNPASARLLGTILAEDWRSQATLLERAVVITYRLRHWGLHRAPRAAWRPVAIVLAPLELMLRTMISGQISAHARIGRRLRIPHPWGIVIHSSVRIGDNCIIYHQVTLGINEHGPDHTGPRLEDGVYVGAGAKVIGPVTVGEAAVIGANAVVIRDVPPRHTAAGVPAVCKPRHDRTRPAEDISDPDRAVPGREP